MVFYVSRFVLVGLQTKFTITSIWARMDGEMIFGLGTKITSLLLARVIFESLPHESRYSAQLRLNDIYLRLLIIISFLRFCGQSSCQSILFSEFKQFINLKHKCQGVHRYIKIYLTLD